MAKSPPGAASVTGAGHTLPQWKLESAAYYREYAAQIRDLADGEPDTVLRDRLRAIAEEYQRLADHLDPKP